MVFSFYCLYTFLLDEKHAITIQTEEGPVLRSKAILYENLSETFQMFLSENEDLKGRHPFPLNAIQLERESQRVAGPI